MTGIDVPLLLLCALLAGLVGGLVLGFRAGIRFQNGRWKEALRRQAERAFLANELQRRHGDKKPPIRTDRRLAGANIVAFRPRERDRID